MRDVVLFDQKQFMQRFFLLVVVVYRHETDLAYDSICLWKERQSNKVRERRIRIISREYKTTQKNEKKTNLKKR